MKKAFAVFAFLLPALFSCEYVLAQQAIPPSFFGIHVNNPTLNNQTSYPLGDGGPFTYGEFRNWDVYQVDWPDIETCAATAPSPSDPCFGTNGSNFGPLQTELTALHSAGVNNVLFTLARTPSWAVTTAQGGDSSCSYYDPNNPLKYGGACYAPIHPLDSNNNVQLAPDGTGQDLTWRNWVGALATYVNGQTWCGSSCAHVKYWEIWNEFDRNNTDPNDPNQSGTNGAKVSWFTSTNSQYGCQPANGPCPTVDQLIRMTEDARCVITGTGTVDNYMSPGDSHTCLDLRQNHGWPAPIDSTAQIVQPSITSPSATTALECYLYCNSTKCSNWHQANACQNTWSSLPGAVDIINFHYYNPNGVPENLNTTANGNIRSSGVLQSAELSKPLWVGEGAWPNSLATNGWSDPYAQGGFIPRWFASIWSQTMPYGSTPCNWSSEVCQQAFWYGYDEDNKTPTCNPTTGYCYKISAIGALYCPGDTAHGYCGFLEPGGGSSSFLIEPTEDMWNVGVGWLQNVTPANPFCYNNSSLGSTVWRCDFTNFSIIWDNSYAVSAQGHSTYCATNFASNPYVCGDTEYPVSLLSGYNRWEDLSGTTRNINEMLPHFMIGLNPVKVEP